MYFDLLLDFVAVIDLFTAELVCDVEVMVAHGLFVRPGYFLISNTFLGKTPKEECRSGD